MNTKFTCGIIASGYDSSTIRCPTNSNRPITITGHISHFHSGVETVTIAMYYLSIHLSVALIKNCTYNQYFTYNKAEIKRNDNPD